MPPEFEYVGNELELFSRAKNWKSYFRSSLRRYLTGDVLEVGAGLGGTTTVFQNEAYATWTCLEPDQTLLEQLKQKLSIVSRPDRYLYQHGTLSNLGPGLHYDTIIYIDVLEHIEHDRDEVALAAARLKPGGRLIILSPAFQFLYTPFDQRIGHFRRYTLGMLNTLTPAACQVEQGYYLDSVGMLASLGNRLLLKASMPKVRQIAFWDKVLVRCSRVMDWIVLHSFGRSVIIVWQKQG